MKANHIIPILFLAIVGIGCNNVQESPQFKAEKAAFLQYIEDSLIDNDFGTTPAAVARLFNDNKWDVSGDTINMRVNTSDNEDITDHFEKLISYYFKCRIAYLIPTKMNKYKLSDFDRFGAIFRLRMVSDITDCVYYEDIATPQDYLPLAIWLQFCNSDRIGFVPKDLYKLYYAWENEKYPESLEEEFTCLSVDFDGDIVYKYKFDESTSDILLNFEPEVHDAAFDELKELFVEDFYNKITFFEIADYKTYDINIILKFYNHDKSKLIAKIKITPEDLEDALFGAFDEEYGDDDDEEEE